mmetsp:Transcript_27056/g.88784  ORF Transcript_27056/g.88784 Transcript_27056/m.88784 type:complete len:340 (+) Transcript_27056:815-1834(+)
MRTWQPRLPRLYSRGTFRSWLASESSRRGRGRRNGSPRSSPRTRASTSFSPETGASCARRTMREPNGRRSRRRSRRSSPSRGGGTIDRSVWRTRWGVRRRRRQRSSRPRGRLRRCNKKAHVRRRTRARAFSSSAPPARASRSTTTAARPPSSCSCAGGSGWCSSHRRAARAARLGGASATRARATRLRCAGRTRRCTAWAGSPRGAEGCAPRSSQGTASSCRPFGSTTSPRSIPRAPPSSASASNRHHDADAVCISIHLSFFLQEGRIAGAWSAPSLLTSPHAAGGADLAARSASILSRSFFAPSSHSTTPAAAVAPAYAPSTCIQGPRMTGWRLRRLL